MLEIVPFSVNRTINRLPFSDIKDGNMCNTKMGKL